MIGIDLDYGSDNDDDENGVNDIVIENNNESIKN